jgi:restriction endonuclease S subunit
MGHIDTFNFEGEYVTWTTDGANAGTVFYRNGQFNCTNVCGTLKAKDTFDVDHRFMAFQLGQLAKRHVSYIGNPKLMNGVMAEIELLKPPYSEQKSIATILNTIDEAIAAAEAQLAKQEKIKQGLLQDLLTRGIDESGQIRPHWEDRPDLYKKTDLGVIPKDWDIQNLESLSSLITSGSRNWADFYSNVGALFIRIGNLTRENINLRFDSIVYVDLSTNKEGQRTRLSPGDILVSITADLGIVSGMPTPTLLIKPFKPSATGGWCHVRPAARCMIMYRFIFVAALRCCALFITIKSPVTKAASKALSIWSANWRECNRLV